MQKCLRVNIFLIILSALTVQADDVLISNPSDNSVQFRVVIRSTGFDKTITLQPGEHQNAIGTSLWHNARVEITGLASKPDGSDFCFLLIEENAVNLGLFPFYLPEVTSLSMYEPCTYTTNVPNCGCFNPHSGDRCFVECEGVKNAQVVVQH